MRQAHRTQPSGIGVMRPAPKSVKVLLVDGEKKFVHALKGLLSRNGYVVDVAHDGAEALEMALGHEYGLIILEVNLPNKSGIEVLTELRSNGYRTPVLVLSACDKVKERLEGFRAGADDYLVKPFDSDELLVRMRAILVRSGLVRVAVFEAADLRMDVVSKQVLRAGREIPLTPLLLSLLEFFLRNRNQILTRKRLAEAVWGNRFDRGTNYIDVAIWSLRKAVDEGFSPKLIHTVHGEGFMLKDG